MYRDRSYVTLGHLRRDTKCIVKRTKKILRGNRWGHYSISGSLVTTRNTHNLVQDIVIFVLLLHKGWNKHSFVFVDLDLIIRAGSPRSRVRLGPNRTEDRRQQRVRGLQFSENKQRRHIILVRLVPSLPVKRERTKVRNKEREQTLEELLFLRRRV